MSNIFIYVVTGILRDGKRFKPMYYTDIRYALGINLYHGSVWRHNNLTGKRTLIKRVIN